MLELGNVHDFVRCFAMYKSEMHAIQNSGLFNREDDNQSNYILYCIFNPKMFLYQ